MENKPTPLIANALWYLLSLPDSLAFRRACRDVAATQENLLLRLLRRNAGTEIGRRYDFASIRSAAAYQDRVPLSTYEDYQIAIERIGQGRPAVLTQEPTLLLEPTGGSTAATKYIPYTASLKAEFQRAIAPWVVNAFNHNPALLRGQAYWSISPVSRDRETTPAGIPIGFEEDSDYFGDWRRRLIQTMMAVPPPVRLIDDMAAFRYVTLLFLLRSRSLALISIWNPTFLTLLMQPLRDWRDCLAADIAQGALSPPTPLASDLHAALKALNPPDPRRAAEIRAAFQNNGAPATIHACLWPQLRLISCWTDAHAALHAPQLARLFPQAHIQGKGLLATEGVVSFPLAGCEGRALAVRSHFFEFLPLDATSRPRLAHELTPGQSYEVVLTTGGGLYRYQLGDVVRVTAHLDDCPLLRFEGKAGQISDHFGEKLNEAHVRQALARRLDRCHLQPDFAMLAFEELENGPAYVLFIEVAGVANARLRRLGLDLEQALQENFHYRYCRDLGQLGPLRIFRINGHAEDVYLSVCRDLGQRSGDVKPVALHRMAGWSRFFEGEWV